MHGPRKPRASLSVTLLEDPDCVVLLSHGDEGLRAFSVFVLLVVKAKGLDNDGIFRQPITAIASTIRVSTQALSDAIELIGRVCTDNESTPWLSIGADRKSLHINGFQKWNSGQHGGTREGSGRRPVDLIQHEKNQDSIKRESSAPIKIQLDSPRLSMTERNVTRRDGTERNGTGEPISLPTTADAVTPSDRYSHRPATDSAFASLPPARRRKQTRFAAEFIAALGRSGLPQESLVDRLVAYYASPEGSSRFARDADRFLADDGFAEPSVAWERSSGATDTRDAAKAANDAEFEAMLAEVVAERGLS